MLATYIQLLLIGVPVVLLAAHWREAWARLDGWFDRLDLMSPRPTDNSRD